MANTAGNALSWRAGCRRRVRRSKVGGRLSGPHSQALRRGLLVWLTRGPSWVFTPPARSANGRHWSRSSGPMPLRDGARPPIRPADRSTAIPGPDPRRLRSPLHFESASGGDVPWLPGALGQGYMKAKTCEPQSLSRNSSHGHGHHARQPGCQSPTPLAGLRPEIRASIVFTTTSQEN